MRKPRILLIGAGRFGMHYVRLLTQLHEEGAVTFVGVVVKTVEHAAQLAEDQRIEVFAEYDAVSLASVDMVFVVTPVDTHFEIVSDCIPHADVFVEKPMTQTLEEARQLDALAEEYNRVLMIGHIFRFHPVTQKLRSLLKEESPLNIEGVFVNSIDTDLGRPIAMELLHLFDIVDYLYQPEVTSVHATSSNRTMEVSVTHNTIGDATYRLGWEGVEKRRRLKIVYEDIYIDGDFLRNRVVVQKGDEVHSYECETTEDALRSEIEAFIYKTRDMVSPQTAMRSMDIALKAQACTNLNNI